MKRMKSRSVTNQKIETIEDEEILEVETNAPKERLKPIKMMYDNSMFNSQIANFKGRMDE